MENFLFRDWETIFGRGHSLKKIPGFSLLLVKNLCFSDSDPETKIFLYIRK